MVEHAVDNRAVEGSSPSGCISLWGVGVDGEHARLSIERWPVRIRYALLKFVGSWASWSGRSPVKAEITGSSPVGPVNFALSLNWIGSSIVQSACLLSKKLWVQIPPDPPKVFYRVAQLAERRSVKPVRAGSSPAPVAFSECSSIAQSARPGPVRSQVQILPL